MFKAGTILGTLFLASFGNLHSAAGALIRSSATDLADVTLTSSSRRLLQTTTAGEIILVSARVSAGRARASCCNRLEDQSYDC